MSQPSHIRCTVSLASGVTVGRSAHSPEGFSHLRGEGLPIRRTFYVVFDRFGTWIGTYPEVERAERVASSLTDAYVVELIGYRP